MGRHALSSHSQLPGRLIDPILFAGQAWQAGNCPACSWGDEARILGVGGPYCSGKTTIAQTLAEGLGWTYLEVDSLGHQALAQSATTVIATFGPQVAAADGTIDRRALGRLVFASEAERHRLEAIVHPMMRQAVIDAVKRARNQEPQGSGLRSGLVVSAALLYYMNLAELCDRVIWITAPYRLRLARAMDRDHLSRPEAAQRLRAQTGLLPKAQRRSADILIVANRSRRLTLRRLIGIMERGTWIKNGL